MERRHIQEMKLLFVEMGVGNDLHGQDITAAAMRACRDAISSNSIPAFRKTCSIPGVTPDHMKLHVKLEVPCPLQQHFYKEKIKPVFPYGNVTSFEIVDGGLVCPTEELAEKSDDCYIVNAAVNVGY